MEFFWLEETLGANTLSMEVIVPAGVRRGQCDIRMMLYKDLQAGKNFSLSLVSD